MNSSIVRYFTKGTSVTRSPVITKTGWLKCQWCGASPPPDDSPLLGCRGRIWETYIILTQMGCKPICDARVETTVSSLYIATYPQVTHFLTLWRILLASINLNDYILVTDCKWWVQNSPFRGLVYRGVFLRSIFFHEGLLVLVWLLWQFRLIADARFANANCDFFVNFQKHCYVLAFFVGYLLRASFFKTTFNFRHCHCCKVSPSIGCPMDRRYFNQEATSAIFSKNFLTNFFFGLLFGLSRCLPIRGIIFRKP